MSMPPMDDRAGPDEASPGPHRSSVYFDGTSSRRHEVTLAFGDCLEIDAAEGSLAAWPYADIRRADSPIGILRLSCVTAPALARLEIRDAARGAGLIPRCT